MTTTSLDFLNSTDLSISEDVQFEEFDPQDLKDFNNLLESEITFTESEALEGLLQSSKTSDKSDKPTTPSYQPLNEAGVLTSGESLNKSAIGSVTNNSISIQEDAQTSLINTAKFTPEGMEVNPTEETLKKMKDAQQTLSTGIKSLANGAELANSGIKFAGGNLQFAGNSIQLGTDGMVHITSPIINSVAEVENKQANTLQTTSNQLTTVTKSSFKQVEELDSTVAQNVMKTVTQSDISVSNFKSTTALEKAVLNSDAIENTAGSIIKNRSQDGIVNEAEGIISTTSPSISIMAAEGAKSASGNKEVVGESAGTGLTENSNGSFDVSAVSPDGGTVKFSGVTPEEGKEKWKTTGGLEGQNKEDVEPSKSKKGKGDLSILADGEGGTVSIINKNMILSSTKNYNASVGGNLSQVAKGNVTSSGRFVNTEADAGLTLNGSGYIRQQSGRTGTMISNGFTFAGFRFPNLSKYIDKAKNVPLEIREIPALSKLPLAIGVSDLADCIPKKYTDPDIPEDDEEGEDGPDPVAAPTKADAKQRDKPSALPVGKDAGTVGPGGLIDAVKNVGSSKIDGDTILNKDYGPTDQTAVPRNKLTSAAAVLKGGADVYAPESQEAFDLFKRQGSLIIDPDAGEEVGGPELARDLIQSLSALSITNISIKLNQPPEYAEALKEDVTAVKNYLFTEFQISSDLLEEEQQLTPEQGKFIDDANAIPELKAILDELRSAVLTRAAVGGVLSFLTEAYERVSDSVSIASDLIEDNSESNVFQVLKGASDIAGALTDDNIFTDISSIISSSESLSNIYGQVNSIVKDGKVTTSEVIDKLNFKDIENVISSGLNTIGVDNLQTATNIARILRDVKNSQEYKTNGLNTRVREEIILEIIDETGLTNNQARTLYNNAQDVIANVLAGDVESIIEGSELQNLLGFFIGRSNAALLSDLRKVYTKGSQVIAQGASLFNTGRDLYQNGMDLYSTIQAVPALVGVMNNYEVPLLNQVKIVLQCFEVLDQVKRIMENIKSAATTFDKFGNSIEGTFDAFDRLSDFEFQPIGGLLGRLAPGPSTLQSVSEGFAKGSIAPIESPNNLVDQRNRAAIITDESSLLDNNQQRREELEDEILIDGEPLTGQNCSTVIFSNQVDRKDSADPSDWEEVISREDTIDLIEKLPRLTQIYNSIKESPDSVTPDGTGSAFGGLTPTQVNSIKESEIAVPVNPCYLAPKLNLVESTVEIIEVKDNVMLYKMKYPQSLKFNNKNVFPSNNTIVQIYVERFFNNKTRQEMEVYRTMEFFSPHIYSFKTTVYDRDKNLGIAYLMNSQTRIHLKSASDIPYNYSITDIGKKLDPIIVDAYIVA